MIDDESLKNIRQLHELKTEGMITEEEFERAKERLLFGSRSQPKAMFIPGASVEPRTPGEPMTTTQLSAELDWALLPFYRYADFSGRSSRKEFWMFAVLTNIVCVLLAIFAQMNTNIYDEIGAQGKFRYALIALVILGTFIPMLAVQVRRFHDQDKSGWFALFNLIPYIGVVIVLIFMFLKEPRGKIVSVPIRSTGDGMARIIAIMLIFALLLTAIKAAVILLILAGLIFRTKETMGLLLLFGMVKLFTTFPWSTTGVAFLILLTICFNAIMKSQTKTQVP